MPTDATPPKGPISISSLHLLVHRGIRGGLAAHVHGILLCGLQLPPGPVREFFQCDLWTYFMSALRVCGGTLGGSPSHPTDRYKQANTSLA